jgi:uncharacterized membrane protein HdeD (DUF308 family)
MPTRSKVFRLSTTDQPHPTALAIWIGVGFIFQGVAETSAAISFPRLPGRGWHIFAGITSVIAGIVVLASPFASIVVLTVVAGVWLVVMGFMQFVRSFQIRRDCRCLRHGGRQGKGGFRGGPVA